MTTMPYRRLVAFATREEAHTSIQILGAVKEGDHFRYSDGIIIITGMGTLRAALAIAPYLHQVDEVWNVGIAGSLNDSIAIGSIHAISSVAKNLSLPASSDGYSRAFADRVFPLLPLGHAGVRLISSDYPIHDRTARKTLAIHADLVDMEGYGIAFAAHQAHKPCTLYKAVSDFAQPNGQLQIKQMIAALSEEIANCLKV